MKKNILTIVIMACTVLNLVLNIIIIFSIVPASNKTNKLVDKVASVIDLELENGVVTALSFTGGCHGNLQGIGKLVEGMKVEEVIARLDGIRCGGKATSCPDQLAQALKQSI